MVAAFASLFVTVLLRKTIPSTQEWVTRGTIVMMPGLFVLGGILLTLFRRDLEADAPGWRMRWLERLVAVAVPLFVHFFDPPIWMDDAGFILRYFAQAQEGCFYCFNAADGPVFGISSFLFGLLGNALAWTGILDPEQCLLVLTYAGLYFATKGIFGLLRVGLAQPLALPLAFLATLAFNKSFWAAGNGGMEAPLHLAVCLYALKAFVERRHLPMWGLLALATISKLDAVPLVLVVGLLWLIRERRGLLPLSTRNPLWASLILGGIVPILLYVGVVTLLFGSPLPQSAYVKAFLQKHPDDSFFPFLSYYLESRMRIGLLGGGLLLFAAYQVQLWWAKAADWTTQTAPGWAFVGVMALYYVYNPAEKMLWYYVLPETLLLLQAMYALAGLGKRLPARLAFPAFLVGLAVPALFFLTHTLNEVRWFRLYERWVEVERVAVGRDLGARMAPGDTLMAGHGLISAFTPGYVIDITGLNSKLATSYQLDLLRMLRERRPQWVAIHGWEGLMRTFPELPYDADTAYYDITLHRYSAWRVWHRMPDGAPQRYWEAVSPAAISGDQLADEPGLGYHRILSHRLQLAWDSLPAGTDGLDMGIYRRKQPYTLTVRQFIGDSVVQTTALPVAAMPEWQGPPYFSQSLRMPLLHAPGRPFRIEFAAPDTATFEVVDPMLRIRRR